MPQPPFVLIAQAPAGVAPQVVERLNASFGVNVPADHLIAGAAVLQAPTKEELEARVSDVLGAGATCRIVDAAGAIVMNASSPPNNRTLVGMQPGPPPALVGPPVAPPSPPPASPAPPPVPGMSSPAAPPSLDNLDRLDDNALVALDGSVDTEPSTAAQPEPVELIEPPTDGHFTPPADSRFEQPNARLDEPLELDVSPMAAMPPPDMAPIISEEIEQAPVSTPSRRAAPQARFKPIPRWVLFDGLLRKQWPRLRIVIGFVLALAFGSIWPACHASSVIDRHIEPARKELSRAKAYGHLLANERSFRSADEIESYIGSLKRRHAGYGVVIWLMCGGAVGFLWFRFT